ncbi:hypothetical protein A4G18_00320 [Pasteurellaceae bacterium Pebbles2]|nr:hypothetical protein [Pasteurellaceae bacterium Pebbles2]
MLNLLFELSQQNRLSQADYFFAKFINEKQQGLDYDEQSQQLAVLAAALCQFSLSQGNTCLFLEQELEQDFFGLGYVHSENSRDYLAEIQQKIGHLAPAMWAEKLANHIAFSTQPAQKIAPMVFQHNALYFYRTWQDENRLADYIKSAVQNDEVLAETAQWRETLDRYFSPPSDKINWQKVAVAVALSQSFCLISGGPGTGKTYTVARLLAVLQELHQGKLHIGLAAPTGKAAARLKESIDKEFAQQPLQQLLEQKGLMQVMPKEAKTLHRLLGVRPFSEQTTYHQERPLPYDVLIIDEASMIDLSLMSKLRMALSAKTKLILLGDKDQLSSVEAGAILGELGQFIPLQFDEKRQKNIACYDAKFHQFLTAVTGETLPLNEHALPALSRCLCYLPDSRRFDAQSSIGHLASAVNRKDYQSIQQSWEILQKQLEQPEEQRKVHLCLFDDKTNVANAVVQIVKSAVQNYRDYLMFLTEYQAHLSEAHFKELFTKFNAVRFLTALRNGEFGVENLNHQIAHALQQAGLVQFQQDRDWYVGKPIMITQNDHHANLFNGDIGLYVGNNQVCFERGGRYDLVSRSRIPSQFEPAYVMTVHKSQGSEFEHTFLVLPLENNPVLSKELIYTAVTRAKTQFSVFCSESIWRSAVARKSKRQSGLKFALDQ